MSDSQALARQEYWQRPKTLEAEGEKEFSVENSIIQTLSSVVT